MNPWLGDRNIYEFSTISKGNNPLSLLEIVSSLNCFNLARWQYHYSYVNCLQKYNPKVYFGTIQTVAGYWNLDAQNGQNWVKKSGSWHLFKISKNYLHF